MIYTLFLSLIGCTQDNEGSVMPYCEELETSVEADEVTPLGISISDITNEFALNYTSEIVWSDGTSSCLNSAISPDLESARYVESTAVYPEAKMGAAVPAIAVECYNYIAVDALLSFSSDDGLLEEELTVTITFDELQSATGDLSGAQFYVEVDGFGRLRST